jgi:hypothetical protein
LVQTLLRALFEWRPSENATSTTSIWLIRGVCGRNSFVHHNAQAKKSATETAKVSHVQCRACGRFRFRRVRPSKKQTVDQLRTARPPRQCGGIEVEW